MVQTTVVRYCDCCNKEMHSRGKLKLSYSVVDYAGNGAPAGISFEDLCDDCCKAIHQAIVDVCNKRKA